MRRVSTILITVLWLLAATVVTAPHAAGSDVLLTDPGGSAVQWSTWLADNGPAAVLVWASWVPGSEASVDEVAGLKTVCDQRDLRFLVIAVQEPLTDSRARLQGRAVRWLHDRHGAILKHHRVTWVPQLLIVDADGNVLDRLQPQAEALRHWVQP